MRPAGLGGKSPFSSEENAAGLWWTNEARRLTGVFTAAEPLGF